INNSSDLSADGRAETKAEADANQPKADANQPKADAKSGADANGAQADARDVGINPLKSKRENATDAADANFPTSHTAGAAAPDPQDRPRCARCKQADGHLQMYPVMVNGVDTERAFHAECYYALKRAAAGWRGRR